MSYDIQTRCIHGQEHSREDALCSISYPIYQTASFSHLTPGHNPSGFDYSRESNPTRSYLEETISSLEYAADSIAFSSGMAAISACFELFRPGDHVICTDDLYGGSVRLFQTISEKNGLEIDFVDTSHVENINNALRPNTKAIYVETPTNPMMHVTDIAAAAQIAQAAGALLIVDNTFLTPYLQNPLLLGADLVVHSGTKYLSGHNDTISGFLCIKDQALADRLRLIAKTTGAVLAPFDSWLVHRGIKTLPIRMERHEENARHLVHVLQNIKYVKNVYYVGLPGHPGYELNKKQARGAGGMISFEVDSAQRARKLLESVRLITFAESLGGTESLLTYPIAQTHTDVPQDMREKAGITDRLLRLSVGLESAKDLEDDLLQAFGLL